MSGYKPFAGVDGLFNGSFGGGFGDRMGRLRGDAFLVPVVGDGHLHERPERVVVGKTVARDDDGPGRVGEDVAIVSIGDHAADFVPTSEVSLAKEKLKGRSKIKGEFGKISEASWTKRKKRSSENLESELVSSTHENFKKSAAMSS